MIKFPKPHAYEYVSEFQHWFVAIENEWVDILIPSKDADDFPQQQYEFLQYAEAVISDLIGFGHRYIQKFTNFDLQDGGLNAIRYNEFNGIPYIELQYNFEQDPEFLWSVGFEKNPLLGYSLDVQSSALDYGFTAIILHREPN